jgi:thiol-disulfide isomerase/thioredoxin
MKKILVMLSALFTINTASQAQYANNTIKIGMVAPEIKLATPNKDTLSLLKESKARYLLVDFWASWCGPCRAANPELVAMYNKYSAAKFKDAKKGFTVFSVSLDKNHDAWTKAIEKDKLAWKFHVSDLGGWNSSAAATYGVQFIPQAVLIGPDSKIIGTYNNVLEAKADLDRLMVSDAKTTPATKTNK